MKQKKIFCEKLFLKRFLNEKPEESFPGDADYQKYENWRQLYRLLSSSDTTIGCTEETFLNDNVQNNLFRKLLKRKTDGYCNLLFSEKKFPNLSSLKDNPSLEELSAVYLTETGLHDSAKINGVINISIDDIPFCARFFYADGDAIGKDEELSWLELKDQLKHNCNSMVFVDNYGLKSMENNLFMLFDILLPEKMNVVFNITIVSTDISNDDKSKIKNYLKKKRPNLTYSIQFLSATITIVDRHNNAKEVNLFHDRAIITNNIWIGIGGGFDIFRKTGNHYEANKTTTLDVVYPFIRDSDKYKDIYNFLIEDVNDAFNQLKETPNNRILKM